MKGLVFKSCEYSIGPETHPTAVHKHKDTLSNELEFQMLQSGAQKQHRAVQKNAAAGGRRMKVDPHEGRIRVWFLNIYSAYVTTYITYVTSLLHLATSHQHASYVFSDDAS